MSEFLILVDFSDLAKIWIFCFELVTLFQEARGHGEAGCVS